MEMRINKYLAEHGYCSRREADNLIKAGIVFVNGRRANLGDKVGDEDKVKILRQTRIKEIPKKIYLLLNKPRGYITTTDARSSNTVLDLVPKKDRLFPVGRLDVASTGLLIMTNDGDLANKLTHPRYEHDKEYEVTVDKPISDSHLAKLASGIDLDGKMTLPAVVKRLKTNMFSIVLREGRNRQIRRMCDALGYTVRILNRVRVLTLRLGDLEVGKTRPLTDAEVASLKKEKEKSPVE